MVVGSSACATPSVVVGANVAAAVVSAGAAVVDAAVVFGSAVVVVAAAVVGVAGQSGLGIRVFFICWLREHTSNRPHNFQLEFFRCCFGVGDLPSARLSNSEVCEERRSLTLKCAHPQNDRRNIAEVSEAIAERQRLVLSQREVLPSFLFDHYRRRPRPERVGTFNPPRKVGQGPQVQKSLVDLTRQRPRFRALLQVDLHFDCPSRR
mmetsp:Transcript_91583/g.191440  ORF Transcript_91583/g.191440 Transcript_91583/m.191440 type:complete len:207 (+) Transcript_91583:523-1143(+)